MHLLLRWIINAAALFLTVQLLAAIGLAQLADAQWWEWFVVVLVMGLVNACIRPVLLLLTAPLNCLTFGIVGALVNALMFWLAPTLAASLGIRVFQVGFWGALLGTLVLGAVSGLLNNMLINDRERV